MNQWSCVAIVFVGLILDDVWGKSGGHGKGVGGGALTLSAKNSSLTAKNSEVESPELVTESTVRTSQRGKSPVAPTSKRIKTPVKKTG